MRRTLSMALALLAAPLLHCSGGIDGGTDTNMQAAGEGPRVGLSPAASDTPSKVAVDPTVDYNQALRSAALKLTGDFPTLTEIKALQGAADPAAGGRGGAAGEQGEGGVHRGDQAGVHVAGVLGAAQHLLGALVEVAHADGVPEEEAAGALDDEEAHGVERERGEEDDEEDPGEGAAALGGDAREDLEENGEAEGGEGSGEEGVDQALHHEVAREVCILVGERARIGALHEPVGQHLDLRRVMKQ